MKSSNLDELSKKEPLIVSELHKVFTKGVCRSVSFHAVNNLSFGVQQNECFGLLGVNGAGKTTTLQILIGHLNGTSGSTFINGYDIKKDRYEATLSLGYCPQFDYLPEYLTVEQSLRLFASLRGLHGTSYDLIIKDFIDAFKLNEFKNRLVQNLSGGNKRKLSSALALIGKPKTVILDEVSIKCQEENI